LELPADPDEPEEPDEDEPEAPAALPSPPPLRWSVLSACAALFLPGAFAVFFALLSLAELVIVVVSSFGADAAGAVVVVLRLLLALGVVVEALPLAEPL